MLKKSERKPLIKRYVECLGLNHLLTQIGQEVHGNQEEVDMFRQSKFELKYKFERGHIIRTIHGPDNQEAFSNSYETLRVFDYLPGNKECFSSII